LSKSHKGKIPSRLDQQNSVKLKARCPSKKKGVGQKRKQLFTLKKHLDATRQRGPREDGGEKTTPLGYKGGGETGGITKTKRFGTEREL